MLHRSHRQYLISLIMALALFGLTLAGGLPNARAATIVTVYPTQQYQVLRGWGSSMAWWANWAGSLSDTQRNALADALFNTNTGIGLNVLRYNFGADGPGNVCHNAIASGKAGVYTNIPTYEPSAGTYDWNQDANQRWVLQAAKQRGANLFEGFVNSPPAWMLTNSCTSGASGNAENLSSAHYDDFVNYMATIAQHFHDSWGVTFQTLAPFNEPTPGYWNFQGDQEGMNVSTTTQNTIIKKLGVVLSQTGVSAYTSISASDDTSVDRSNSNYNTYDSQAKGYIAQYNTHTYGGSDSDRDYAYNTIGQGDNKRLWMSEWGTGAQSSEMAAAITLSREILRDEQHLHPSSWVIWQAADNYFNGSGSGNAGSTSDLWGLAATDSSGNIIYPARYYGFGNYSKFVRPGYQMIGNSDSNTFSAYDAASKTLVLVATNGNTTATDMQYSLSNFTSVGSIATPYRTSSSEHLAQLSSLSIANKTLSTSLPAQSITTFVIPNVTYTPAPVSYSKIVSRNSGKVLDVQGQSTQDGGSIIQYSDNGGTNQQWQLVDTGDGYVKIVNRNSGKLLDVSGQSTANGGPVIQYHDNGGANQQWQIVDIGGGYVKIINRHSGKALDVTGQSTSDGAPLEQWDYWGGANQQWQIVSV
ncbi:RICIN domain-containing protein [Ktedonospora formicarum]|uniref:Ricin B lectin domain-containing protein n=1 Tax=Ktedonospora formicarum TaxID=2778364 RepID=A0A8J3I149_9CHLR|nr:RICIN domain-containing protein [Ktedonospora formicarum]GHO46881.1 hypothetical protein KSX_50440 [Ktedonospora formicarum]